MKKIYMVQPNPQYGKSVYLPYAVGSLIAYAFSDETIKKEYSFEGFVYKRESIEAVVSRMNNPFLVGFSCYIWNYEYNQKLAARIKEAFPECIIVFGGHQINPKSEVVEAEYVDYIIHGEGEEALKGLLLYLCGKEIIENIPNLVYKNSEGEIIINKTSSDFVQRVSPYTEGWFDNLFEEEELEFSAIIETCRGCPNSCAFCDWGNIKSKIKKYDIELVKAEIDWLSSKKIEYCYCADSNFGLFPRDIEIVDYVVEKHNKTGYPDKFQACYSKTNPERVFEINKKLNRSGLSKGATLSFQSFNQQVLDNIYRKNMPLDNFHKLMSLYNSNNILAYSELILGLPGETYESFKNGIELLIEAGQHMMMDFYSCELLSNSIMSDPEYMKKHGIKYATIEQYRYHTVVKKEDIPEFSKIVVSTNTMSEEEWIESNILHVFVRAFHSLGLLQCVAIYLFHEKQIKYVDFYSALIEWAKKHKDSICGQIYMFLKKKYIEIINNSGSLTYFDSSFGEVAWPLEEATFLTIIKNHTDFYKEISPFIKDFFDDEAFYEELMSYQKVVVKKPSLPEIVLNLHYDFYDYFSGIYSNNYRELKKADTKLLFNLSDIPGDFKEYAKKMVWYGRRGSQIIVSDISYV